MATPPIRVRTRVCLSDQSHNKLWLISGVSVQSLLDADSRTRHGKFGDMTKEQLTDYEICNKQLASIIDIGNSMKHQLHQLIEWFKSLGIFNELCLDDQASLKLSRVAPCHRQIERR